MILSTIIKFVNFSIYSPSKKKNLYFILIINVYIFVETSDKLIQVVGLHMYEASSKMSKSMFNHN